MLKLLLIIPHETTIIYNSIQVTILFRKAKVFLTVCYTVVFIAFIHLHLRLQYLLLWICSVCWSQLITYLTLWRRLMCESRAPCWRTTEVRGNESLNPNFVRSPTDCATCAHKTPSETRVCNDLKLAHTTYSYQQLLQTMLKANCYRI